MTVIDVRDRRGRDQRRIAAARQRKAERLAGAVRATAALALPAAADQRLLPAAVTHFTAAQRRDYERIAGVNASSDITWRIVAEMLAGSGRDRALCSTCGLGMPGGQVGPRKPWGHDGPCTR
jgi:hypothetical protein